MSVNDVSAPPRVATPSATPAPVAAPSATPAPVAAPSATPWGKFMSYLRGDRYLLGAYPPEWQGQTGAPAVPAEVQTRNTDLEVTPSVT